MSSRLKRRLAAFNHALRAAAALFFTGTPRRSQDQGKCLADVVLIDPPCLVSGTDCYLSLHTSRELHPQETLEVTLRRNGRTVSKAATTPQRKKSVSVFVPAVDSCGVLVSISHAGHEGNESTAGILALPRGPAEEVRAFFATTVAKIQANGSGVLPGALYIRPDQLKEDWAVRARAGALRSALGTLKKRPNEQRLKAAVWIAYFRDFCSDFAAVLEDLTSGKHSLRSARTPLAAYLLSNRLWGAASHLLRACLRSGAPVTFGLFVLSEDDLGAESLRNGFSLLAGAAADIKVG